MWYRLRVNLTALHCTASTTSYLLGCSGHKPQSSIRGRACSVLYEVPFTLTDAIFCSLSTGSYGFKWPCWLCLLCMVSSHACYWWSLLNILSSVFLWRLPLRWYWWLVGLLDLNIFMVSHLSGGISYPTPYCRMFLSLKCYSWGSSHRQRVWCWTTHTLDNHWWRQRNRIWTNTVPCGTSESTARGFEATPSTTTLWVWSYRKLWVHFSVYPWIPINSSFFSSFEWGYW